jgi:hypothetical protein
LPLVPIATFLAGALLTLLLPVLLLIVLTVWYWKFSERAPETSEADVPAAPAEADVPAAPAEAGAGPSATPATGASATGS